MSIDIDDSSVPITIRKLGADRIQVSEKCVTAYLGGTHWFYVRTVRHSTGWGGDILVCDGKGSEQITVGGGTDDF